MEIIDDLSKANPGRSTVLTIGSFDGVHLGHRFLIRQVTRRARETGLLSCLVTFYPHPRMVLFPHSDTKYITTPGEQAALLEKLGIDLLAILRFDLELARTSAEGFIRKVHSSLRMKEIWVGVDFTFGRDREGDLALLRRMGKEMDFAVHVVRPICAGGEAISSTRIRSLLREGRVKEAAELLGRFYRLAGKVVRGADRGRSLGFPTANLEVRAERAVPARGVYAVYVLLGEERFQGVANIGVRPSFGGGKYTVEAHIFDFDGDLYGQDIVVEFVERLRSERMFKSVEELVSQIGSDVRRAREILAKSG
jgi:riboflavin kinase/FMN adenylyltransferase